MSATQSVIHEQFFEVQGKSLNCAVTPGNGTPLVMLHGVTRRWQTFLPLFPALLPRFEIFAFDYLGHGRSDRTHRGYKVVDYVETMASMLSLPPFSHSKQIVLYGHSLGSMVAAALAAKLGSQVKGLVLEDPPFDTMGLRIGNTPLLSYFAGLQTFASSQQPIGEIARQLAELQMQDPATGLKIRLGDTRDPASLRFTAKCLSQLDPKVLDPIVAGHWLEGFDIESVLKQVKCPTLLLQADPKAGGMLTSEDAARACSLLDDVSHVRVDAAPHLIHWAKTESLVRLVQAFFESL